MRLSIRLGSEVDDYNTPASIDLLKLEIPVEQHCLIDLGGLDPSETKNPE